jgi:hypothetical protein
MNISKIAMAGLAAGLIQGALFSPSASAAESIKDFFPPGVSHEAKHKALEPEQRAYLKQFGVDDRTLDVFGGLFVDGYQANHLRWGDIKPDDLGDLRMQYDTTGMRSFAPMPPAGVHPRMFFTDADREAHRRRLDETKGGGEGKKILMAYTDWLKGKLDREADYAQPDIHKGAHRGVYGFLPLQRSGWSSEANRVIWEAYSTGRVPAPGELPDAGRVPAPHSVINPGLLALEAYRCWVYDDAEGAKKVGRAMETALRQELSQLKPGQLPGDNETGAVKRYFNYNLSYIYDFIYNYLTEEQRELFHGAIVAANFNSNQYGVFQNAKNTTSNWTTFSYRQHGWLGLEGHPGYNFLQYLGYKRAMDNYFTYGWFKAGPCFEAFGKNQIGGEIVYPMAMRGDNVAAHPHILATLREYLPHAIVPWGNAYVAYDRGGGIRPLNANDILPYKNLYPDDKRIDWVYRNTVHPDYGWKEGDGVRVEGYNNNALFSAMWTMDYMEDNDDPGTLMESESFVDGQRGLVITRSDWSTNALYLHYHVRGQSGGHVFADRSSFVLGGRGRIWALNPFIGYETRQNNVVMIDGLQLAPRAPAKLAGYQRTELATFSTADLRDTVNYDYDRLYVLDGKQGHISLTDARSGNYTLPAGWEAEKNSFNDYALVKDTRSDVFTMPRFEKPDWLEIDKAETAVRKKREDIEVTKAFRTIGMVRPTSGVKGEPYVLVLDDWATTDGEAHTYDWQMRLAQDLMIVSQTRYALDKNGKPNANPKPNEPVFYDFLLASKDGIEFDAYGNRAVKPDAPALLVRVLQLDGEVSPDGVAFLGFADANTQKLVLRTRAREPNFKVLFYPHLHRRSPLPVTQWDAARENVSIKIGQQEDQIAFASGPEGRTTFTLTRGDGADGGQVFQYPAPTTVLNH